LLLTAVLLRRRCCWAPATLMQQSIDISCPPDPRQQTRRTLLQRSIAGVYIQTDRRTDIVPLHTVRAVSITRVVATKPRVATATCICSLLHWGYVKCFYLRRVAGVAAVFFLFERGLTVAAYYSTMLSPSSTWVTAKH